MIRAYKITIWVIWVVMFQSLFFYKAYIGNGSYGFNFDSLLKPMDSFMMGALLVSVGLCGVLRWFALPKAKKLSAVLALVIAGIAVGEGLTFYGIFLFRDQGFENLFFWVSVLTVFQFIPLYLGKYSAQRT